MIRHLEYTRARLAQTSARLRQAIYPETRDPDVFRVAGPTGRIAWADAQRLEYRAASLGERFGPLWATYWFRIEAAVPEEWAGKRVDLLRDSASEAALWRDANVNSTHAHTVAALGHAHIDAAWLWPLSESFREVQRTFSSQLGTRVEPDRNVTSGESLVRGTGSDIVLPFRPHAISTVKIER